MPDSSQNLYKKLLGKKGEKLVLKDLKKQGCKILKKNYATPFGEADLIVQDGDEIAFVEVKTRSGDGYGSPAEGVTKAKQARYKKIAAYYISGLEEEVAVRFDVVEVFDGGRVEHIEDAF